MGEDDRERLIFYGLKFPSEYKDVSFEEFQEAFDKGIKERDNVKRGFKTRVIYVSNFDTGLLEAKAKAKIRIDPKVLESTKDFNTVLLMIICVELKCCLKKKKDKVFSILTTLINLLTDLNYLLALSLLETMV